MVLFNVGQIGMRERARVEEFYWRTCEKILRITRLLWMVKYIRSFTRTG
jgi:arginine decarboxylase-like protein